MGRGQGDEIAGNGASSRQPGATITLSGLDQKSNELWESIADLADKLVDVDGWCLVGGLMVQLFAAEAGLAARPTQDIDLLGDARRRPSRTELLSQRLKSWGWNVMISEREDDKGFRFALGDQIIDVLGPDGLKDKFPQTLPGLRTIQIPGGTQALGRTELVRVVLDDSGREFMLRRPTLTGALLVKARSLRVHKRTDDQRRDVATLLSLIDDPVAMRDEIAREGKSQIKWLRQIETKLDIDDPALVDLLGADAVTRARLAYRILIAA